MNLQSASPLAGRIFDSAGNPMTPTFSYGARGKLYRYYVSAPLQQGASSSNNPELVRVSAAKLEARVGAHLSEILNGDSSVDPLACVTRLTLYPDNVRVLIPLSHARTLNSPTDPGVTAAPDSAVPDQLRLTLPVTFTRKDRSATIRSVCRAPHTPDETLIKALKRAHAMIRRDSIALPVLDSSPESTQQRRLIRLAFLAPDLQRDILLGHQPRGVTLAKLLGQPFPPLWSDQIARFL